MTLQLTLASLLLASLLGVPLGVLTAMRQGSRFDAAVMTLTLFGVSMPIFWLGLMLLVLFAAGLGWLPVGGLMPVGLDPPRITGMSIIDSLLSGNPDDDRRQPAPHAAAGGTLASVPLALITRITRAEVLAAATRGSRAHRARQGRGGRPRDPAPHPAQRRDPDRHRDRPAAWPAAVRRGTDRDDLSRCPAWDG